MRHGASAAIALAMASLAVVFAPGGFVPLAAQEPARLQRAAVPPELAQAPATAKLTYWVVLRERADLRAAPAMNREARGRFVVDQLRSTAERSQTGLRALLRARGADFEPFWAANVVKVVSDGATLDLVSRRPEVERIETDRVFTIPPPSPGVQQPAVEAVEWNVANVRANEVWAAFGTRGEGVVVGSIDTGVQFDHPALVSQYRGNLGGGVFDHNYNWYDPSLVCGSPSTRPCDNNNHGTHTMGTIAGDDGGANQIGVAPGARWMTAKGCESSSCSLTALTAAGQWMLAPTDLNGQNPRPDLRPNIVSNSWGGGSGQTFYQQIVQSWVAAGIMPVFANGNSGPACGTVGSPGDYPESYAVGAYDASNLVASFSSRGASTFGVVKPDISAPGVNVRSSIAGNGYAAFNGTSMATPHIAGITALMWSAAPALVGDIASTRTILDQTAINTADGSCGGTAGDNNVYGEGRVDAFAAVDLSPRGPTGTLRGTALDGSTSAPIPGIQVHAAGPSNRSTITDAVGGYSFTVPVGSYDMTASGFGYLTQTATAWVAENAITVQDFALAPAPSVALSGTVRDTADTPVANATVTILGTPIAPASTDADGVYHFASVPMGTYDITAAAGRCNDPQTQRVTLTAPQTLDFTLPPRTDSFGYGCRVVPQAWIDANTVLALSGDDTYVTVALPFSMAFYGGRYSTANVSTNGFVTLATPSAAYSNTTIPSTYEPNTAVYALWDDLYVDASSSVRTETVGSSPTRQFAVEWRNVAFYGDLASRVDLEVILGEGGEVIAQYRNIASGNGREQGNSATIGLENATGTVAFQYAANEAVVTEGLSLRYAVTSFTGVSGTVSDANDHLAIPSAVVRALQGGAEVQRVTTDAAGYYRLYLAAGDYSIEASASSYETASSNVTVTEGTSVGQDFGLRTPRVEVAPTSLSFAVFVGQTARQPLTISNTGGMPADWQIVESGGDVPWLSVSPVSGTTGAQGSSVVEVTVNAAGLSRGTYSATLLVQSNSARRPSISVPISVTVSQYDQAVDTGGVGYYSGSGVYWAPDAVYTPGAWGYTNTASTVETTKKAIAGTADVVLYQTQRVSPGAYSFDGLTPGTYEVTIGFAELRKVKRGARVVDVLANGAVILAGHDMMVDSGQFIADVHTLQVPVTGTTLTVQFSPRAGSMPAVVNAIRLVQR